MEIETKKASLETMSVTIQALHVSGKQMTLSVFRQLPKGQEVEGDPLWGCVRYAIKDEGDVWLVFSHSDRLYRRSLTPPSLAGVQWDIRDAQDRIARLKNCGQAHTAYLEQKLMHARKLLPKAEHDHSLMMTLQQLFIAV